MKPADAAGMVAEALNFMAGRVSPPDAAAPETLAADQTYDLCAILDGHAPFVFCKEGLCTPSPPSRTRPARARFSPSPLSPIRDAVLPDPRRAHMRTAGRPCPGCPWAKNFIS